MIDRINATLDVYSHLRVEVALRDGSRTRGGRPEKNVSPDATGVETESRRRAALPEPEEENNIVRFEQSSVAGDASETAGMAQEDQPALEASVLPADPRMASVARLYQRNGRTAFARSTQVGTQLNVMV